MAPHPLPAAFWAYQPALLRLVLAVVLGVFVGLERERRGKDAGVRTFGFAGLMGCIGGMLGTSYALMSLLLLGLLVVFLNLQRLRTNETAELTTSIALLVTGYSGVLCGLGHTFAPAAITIVAAALLAWKEPLKGFSTQLTEEEIRSAILLAIITFVIYPVLPARPLDPWNLIEPRTAWATVILVAGIGFVNYTLWKKYGTQGVELAGLLGGLVNSTVTVTELANRVEEGGDALAGSAYRGVMLATAAMILRNAVLLGILSAGTLAVAAVPLLFMLIGSAVTVLAYREGAQKPDQSAPPLQITAPFSLQAALKFGLLFVTLDAAGTLAQRFLGPLGFYAISFVGGLISSASAVASAGSLAAHGHLSSHVAGTGAVIAALASAAINWPMVAKLSRHRELKMRLAKALAVVMACGLLGIGVAVLATPFLNRVAHPR